MNSKILQFPLVGFLARVFDEVKKKKDDIQRKKIEYLYEEAYKYYLDLYLVKTIKGRYTDDKTLLCWSLIILERAPI